MHPCNPSAQEVETEETQGHPDSTGKSEARPGCMNCLKNSNNKDIKCGKCDKLYLVGTAFLFFLFKKRFIYSDFM